MNVPVFYIPSHVYLCLLYPWFSLHGVSLLYGAHRSITLIPQIELWIRMTLLIQQNFHNPKLLMFNNLLSVNINPLSIMVSLKQLWYPFLVFYFSLLVAPPLLLLQDELFIGCIVDISSLQSCSTFRPKSEIKSITKDLKNTQGKMMSAKDLNMHIRYRLTDRWLQTYTYIHTHADRHTSTCKYPFTRWSGCRIFIL